MGRDGQLGHGDTEPRLVPTLVGGVLADKKVVGVSCGGILVFFFFFQPTKCADVCVCVCVCTYNIYIYVFTQGPRTLQR